MKLAKRLKAFSLAELLLGMGLFALLVTSVATLSIDSIRAVRNSGSKIIAAQRIQELTNAVLLNKDALWSSIVSNTNAGDKSLVYSGGTYTFQNGAITDAGITIKLNIGEVQRDGSGNIVTSGGTDDLHTRAIITTAQWVDFLGVSNSVNSTVYVSDWNTIKVAQTTDTEFSTGTNDNTLVTKTSDGEVAMDTLTFGDWCKPEQSLWMADLPGQGIAKTISAQPGNIYMGTGSNSSGVSFARMSFIPDEPPVVSTLGTFDGYKTNAVYGEGNYAYLATQTNSKEVVILNVASTPYTEIGYFNPSVNSVGKGIFVNGNVGVMATTSRLYTFDLSSKTGSRPQIGSITLKGTTTDLFVRGNFAYVTLQNSTTELEIIDITNPSSLQSVGWFDLNFGYATTVFVNEAGTRAFVGTNGSSTQSEFFVVDVINKAGSHHSIGSYDAGITTATDIVVPVDSNRALLVGNGGTEQYQVINIEDDTHPQYCGGLAVAGGVTGIAAVTELNGNVYSHIVTPNTSSELRTIRGGAGGGNGSGYGYPAAAEYTSKAFDTGSDSSQYYMLDMDRSVPSGSTLRLQVRTSPSPTMLGSTWVGPDGTSGTYFTAAQTVLPSNISSKRYFQYKAYYTSDETVTAVLNRIEFTYQK